MRTIKEMSRLSGVSIRTLHYYDEIGLVKPSFVGENGYRFYGDEVLPRLQEILLFRELEFPLKDIKKMLASSQHDRALALRDQIRLLELKKSHLEKVIAHAKSLEEGERRMSHFKAYDRSELEAFQEEAKQRWGQTTAYQAFEEKEGQAGLERVGQEMELLMAGFGQLKDLQADEEAVQAQVVILQNYITEHFYPCTDEILAGLGALYVEDERFRKNIDQAGGQGTAAFIKRAIELYCQ